MDINQVKVINLQYKSINTMLAIRAVEDSILQAVKNGRHSIEIDDIKKEHLENIMSHFRSKGFICKHRSGNGVINNTIMDKLWFCLPDRLTISGWSND